MDSRIAQFEQERNEAIHIVHQAMNASYLGPPRPLLLGDAERAVTALILAGWTPPSVPTDAG
jgi:hypothetical protein